MTLSEVVSRNLKAWREERGYSLRGLATLADVSHAHISQIESGKANPTLETVEALAFALQLTPSALLSSEMYEAYAEKKQKIELEHARYLAELEKEFSGASVKREAA